MSPSQRGRLDRRELRRSAIGAIAVGCLLGTLTACSGGSTSATGASTSAAVPTGSATSPAASDAGSGSSALASAIATATAEPTPAGPAADAVLKITVKGRTVSPAPGRQTVSVGDRVQLTVTTDTANVLHIHGVEIEKDTKAGVPLTVTFTVKDPGIYPIELHKPELLLVQLVVR